MIKFGMRFRTIRLFILMFAALALLGCRLLRFSDPLPKNEDIQAADDSSVGFETEETEDPGQVDPPAESVLSDASETEKTNTQKDERGTEGTKQTLEDAPASETGESNGTTYESKTEEKPGKRPPVAVSTPKPKQEKQTSQSKTGATTGPAEQLQGTGDFSDFESENDPDHGEWDTDE